MSDSNYDSSYEKKNSPTLDDMPIHILTRVVNELDFPSRTKLHKTCHGFRDFLNSYDSTCEKMSLTLKSKESGLLLEWSIDQLNVKYMERKNGCLVKVEIEEKEKLLSKSHFLEIGLADFKSAIKNPNFKIKHLSIRYAVGSSFNYRHFDYFLNKLSETLKSLDQKLKVEKLIIHSYYNEKNAISILQFIKPEKLDEICLDYVERIIFLPKKFFLKIDKLTSLEQWKKAKTSKIIGLCLDIPVEGIIHLDEFAGSLKSLSPENIVFLKEVYLQSVTFKSCYIKSCYIGTRNNRENHINIEEVNKLLGPVNPFDRNHPDIRHYPIPNTNQWLLMKITPKAFHIYKTDSPDSYLDPPMVEHPKILRRQNFNRNLTDPQFYSLHFRNL